MKVLIITGEISGDLYGSLLVRRIREINPSFHFMGIGGPKLRGTEVEVLFSAEALSLVGIPKPAELKKYFFIYRKIEELLRKKKVDLVLLVDFPGFNLRIARLAKGLGYPVIYYVAPQVWAWHKHRIKHLKRYVDQLFVILPFEEEFFRNHGIPARYFGHPLLDVVRVNLPRELFYEIFNLHPETPIVGFFPGSREIEITRHLPLFLKVYRELKRRNPEILGILCRAQGLKDNPLWEKARAEFLVLENMQYEVLKYSQASLLASGTITLEAALLQTPSVVTYYLPPWMYFLAKRLVKVPYISLPNLISGKEIYPEVLQERSSPSELASALERVMLEGENIKRSLLELRKALGSPGVTWRIAEEIIKFSQTLKNKP